MTDEKRTEKPRPSSSESLVRSLSTQAGGVTAILLAGWYAIQGLEDGQAMVLVRVSGVEQSIGVMQANVSQNTISLQKIEQRLLEEMRQHVVLPHHAAAGRELAEVRASIANIERRLERIERYLERAEGRREP